VTLCCRLAGIHYGTYYNMFSLFFLLHLCLILLPPFWFHTQKGEGCLSLAAEWSASHPLKYHDRCSVYPKQEAVPIGFLLVLINPPMAGIQSLIQPTELLKVAPHMHWDCLSAAVVYEWIYVTVTHRNHSKRWDLSSLLNLPLLHSSLNCMIFYSHWS